METKMYIREYHSAVTILLLPSLNIGGLWDSRVPGTYAPFPPLLYSTINGVVRVVRRCVTALDDEVAAH
eukprot:scaffold36052_cov51-Attheya_sp.AAC.2